MNLQNHTTPENLERYAFLWSIARLVIAAISLFFGAMPIAYKLLGSSLGYSLLPLFWLISGAASLYLVYMWHKNGKQLFGTNQNQKNTIIFFIMIVTGLNLGYAAIGGNIGMNLVWGMPVAGILFKLTALGYLFVAYHMWQSWKANGEHLFGGQMTIQKEEPLEQTPSV